MIEVGRVCIKIAGRDAGKLGVVVEVLDDKFVMIDGEVRRRKISIKHIEPVNRKVEIKNKASHEEVLKALDIKEKKKRSTKKEATVRPRKVRKQKVKEVVKPKKEKKKEKKKVEKKVEKKNE
ncbi:MAG: 50S ribosomal protein L14e [Nanoarchaeota archaeon]|nr:50S ribosomal protein L14e [Nanoarchaeota archaeon]